MIHFGQNGLKIAILLKFACRTIFPKSQKILIRKLHMIDEFLVRTGPLNIFEDLLSQKLNETTLENKN